METIATDEWVLLESFTQTVPLCNRIVTLLPDESSMRAQRNPRIYYTYILASKSGVLYIGVTGKLEARTLQHKEHVLPGFTERYRITRLLYFEEFGSPLEAIAREKELKGWCRRKKLDLIRSKNPKWQDLGTEWL
jgi:putative endonuclease